jgi:hypothetical protein
MHAHTFLEMMKALVPECETTGSDADAAMLASGITFQAPRSAMNRLLRKQ